jgi:hypothetical protein
MAEDLVKQIREQDFDAEMASNLAEIVRISVQAGKDEAAASLAAKDKEIARLRAVVSDCAKAIGNGAGVAPSSSLEFIELLPGEIAKYTDKLRRFLKCARDEGTEALSRAEQAERVFTDLCEELGCKPDNEAALEAVAALKRALAEAVKVLRPLCKAVLPFTLNGDCTMVSASTVLAARAFVAQHGSDSSTEKE